jgi:hypothetical protein
MAKDTSKTRRKTARSRKKPPTTQSGKRIFKNISPRTWEHPADRAALKAMRAVPGFDLVLRKIFGAVGERSLRLIHLASAARVGENQFPDLWDSYLEACQVLDVEEPPELFVSQTPFVNAGAVGVDRPFIVINSAMLVMLDRDELQSVLGHELGHCLSGHALYHTMLGLLIRLTILALQVPVGGMALFAIIAADRAALLVCQDPQVINRLQLKLAGGGMADQMNPEAFIDQAAEYEAHGNVIDGVTKVLNLIGATHPFPVLRLTESLRWIESGDYDAIMGGTYEQRTEEDQVSVYEQIKQGASSYKESVEVSNDPLMKALRRFTENVGDTARGVASWVKGEGDGGEQDEEDAGDDA